LDRSRAKRSGEVVVEVVEVEVLAAAEECALGVVPDRVVVGRDQAREALV
jgi:hypothetical protein